MDEEQQLLIQGKVGQWVPAILQTAGLYGQSHILEELGKYIYQLGGLIYTVALIAAVTQVALYGRYQHLPQFLFLPGIFLWLLTNTVPVCSVDFQFGEARKDNICEEIKKPLLAVDKEYYAETAQVSWFFTRYDHLISYLVQKTVTAVIDTRENKHHSKLARERILLRLARSRPDNPMFLRLLSMALLGNCTQQFLLASQTATIGRVGADQVSTLINSLGLTPALNNPYFTKSVADYNIIKMTPNHLDNDMITYLRQPLFTPFLASTSIDLARPLTCDQIWQTTLFAAYLGSNALFTPAYDDNKGFPDVDWTIVNTDVRAKIKSTALLADAGLAILPTLSNDEESGSAIILALFYLRNALIYNQLGAMTVGARSYEMSNEAAYRVPMGLTAKHQASATQMDLLYFASFVPYIEGLLLYFLSITFPFFCLFILIPGRQRSFVVWLSLWAWVKSWDIGFAIVYALREILWKMMPGFAFENAFTNFRTMDFLNPAAVLSVVFTNDPLGYVDTYFFLVAMFTISVPAISAMIFTGAGELFEAMRFGGMTPRTKLVDTSSQSTSSGGHSSGGGFEIAGYGSNRTGIPKS